MERWFSLEKKVRSNIRRSLTVSLYIINVGFPYITVFKADAWIASVDDDVEGTRVAFVDKRQDLSPGDAAVLDQTVASDDECEWNF